MAYLGINSEELVNQGGIHTAKEISQQPKIWSKVWDQINFEQAFIQKFLNNVLPNSKRIILTGAGTSAFIGISLRGSFQRNTGIFTEAVSTTDIVSHPGDYFLETSPTLLISFARSGNSPESVAAIELADVMCHTCFHLIITCNADGKLAKHETKSNKFVYTLPQEANDISLAMTGSYTGMLLAGLLISNIRNLQTIQQSVLNIIKYANKILDVYPGELKKISTKHFKRAVFLGSGPFYGTAIESHLKLQELSDGKVICKNDSFLGFRHGPKAVIDDTTLVVYFFSNNEYAYQYERDLIRDMNKGKLPMLELGISELPLETRLPYLFSLSETGETVDEEFLAVCYVLPAQILSFYKSLQLGLRPDNPSTSGAITRVVQGVEIYSLANKFNN